MSTPYAITTEIDDGIAILTFDMPNEPVNKFNRQVKDSMSVAKTWTFTPPGGANGKLSRNFDFINEGLSAQRFYDDTLQVEWLSPIKVYDLQPVVPNTLLIIFLVTECIFLSRTRVALAGDDADRFKFILP